VLSVVLSAIAHDVDHPGNANQFEINSQSDLAMMYKVQAVLESHHCATTFQVPTRPSCARVGAFDCPSWRHVYKSDHLTADFIVVSWQVLRKAKNNFLTGLPKAVAVEVRRTMTECIMATDMAVHFGLITQTKALAADADKSAFTRPQDKLFLCKMLGTYDVACGAHLR